MPENLQQALVYICSFAAMISLVVFVHEFGHFRVARWCGVAIDTFSIGFGKKIFGWRDHKGVQWKVGMLPLGGYVKFTGDADAVSSGPSKRVDDPEELATARARGLFHAQPIYKRALVVIAGPITNFIFSILAFATVALVIGHEVTDVGQLPARIGAVDPQSAAGAAGLRTGDVVLAVDGQAIPNFAALQTQVSGAAGRQLLLQVRRGDETIAVRATPRPRPTGDGQGHLAGQGILGVGALALESERRFIRYNPVEALAFGADRTWMVVSQTAGYIVDVFRRRAPANQIAGPIGIFMASGQVATTALADDNPRFGGRFGVLALSLLSFAALLSVAVGFMNLLPIPVLDGGHLILFGIEALRGGRPLPPAAQDLAFGAGFAVVASLFLFANWNDITRLLPGAH